MNHQFKASFKFVVRLKKDISTATHHMATRSVDSGVVSLGLVSIPVKMYSTSDTSHDVSFRLLHDSCETPLQQQYYCPTHKRSVEREEIVKGYEYKKDEFVTFTDEELEAVAAESTKAIDVTEFVPVDQIDPVYFGKAYYMSPSEGGQKGYYVLAQALEQSGLCALARFATRGNQYLVMIRPYDDGLVMQRLHYAEEIKPFSEVPVNGRQQVTDQELELALQVIEEIRSDRFEPEKYHNEVRDRLEEVIAQRVAGEEAEITPAQEEEAEIVNLIDALQSTLKRYEKQRGAKQRPRRAS